MGGIGTPNCVRRCLRNSLFAHTHIALLDMDCFAQTQTVNMFERLKSECFMLLAFDRFKSH